jgi:hypothetical protein
MIILLAAAATVQNAGIATNSRPAEAVVVSLEAPSSNAIDVTPRIVAVPSAGLAVQPAPPVLPVELRVTAGNRVLFHDTMRVARNNGASYNESRQEASATQCEPSRSYDNGDRQSLNVQLYLQDPQENPRISVSVNWQRPVAGGDCASDGTRSVQVSQSFRLERGRAITIQGDAGLTVTVTPR